MKKLIILLILLASVLFTAGCAEESQKNSTDSQEKNAVVEVTQLEQINASLQKGPILVKMGAEWCGPCQEMKSILKELAIEYEGKATIMSVDVDRSPKLADYFVVNSISDSSVIVGIDNGEYVYMQEDGSVTKDRFKARILGAMDKQVFVKVLDLALQRENVKSK